MDIKVDSNSFFVFDLDDTLFYELDYLKSAYREIATSLAPLIGSEIYNEMWARYGRRENVFQWIVERYSGRIPELTLEYLLKQYREHFPSVKLSDETAAFLNELAVRAIPAGLITDGRSVTQRNKLKALGLQDYFKDVIVSEEFGSAKPDERNYVYFLEKYKSKKFYFFGDNLNKDFIVPIRLGWTVVCLKDTGRHVHPQEWSNVQFPGHVISSFAEVRLSFQD